MIAPKGMAPITPTAGTPAPIKSYDLWAWEVVVCADPANTGLIYVDDADGNVLAKIMAGQSFTLPGGRSPMNLNRIQLDASAASQVCYVSYSV